MYDFDSLFDMRGLIGSRIEKLISEKGITKVNVCKSTGISRPTLDKILSGSLSNKTNYDKHLTKLLHLLCVTPDELVSKASNKYIHTIDLRAARSLSIEQLCDYTGLSRDRVMEIEAGEEASTAELRDIALSLDTGLLGVLGTGFFQTTVSTMNDFVNSEKSKITINTIQGFWGHIGLLLEGNTKYIWFPVTSYTCNRIREDLENDFIVIPCLDNSLLLVKTAAINQIFFLNEACDEPSDCDWDCKVSCGEIPPVVFEAYGDYISRTEYNEANQDRISDKFVDAVSRSIETGTLDPDKMYHAVNDVEIHYLSGKKRCFEMIYDEYNGLIDAVKAYYEFGRLYDDSPFVTFEELSEATVALNLNSISYIRMPLAATEAQIARELAELCEE